MIDCLLRKGVKDDGAGSLALLRTPRACYDRVQSLTPTSPVLSLAVSPVGEKTVEVSHLFPAALFVVAQCSLGPVKCLRSLFANVNVPLVSRGIELRLCFADSGLGPLRSLPGIAPHGATSRVC